MIDCGFEIREYVIVNGQTLMFGRVAAAGVNLPNERAHGRVKIKINRVLNIVTRLGRFKLIWLHVNTAYYVPAFVKTVKTDSARQYCCAYDIIHY